MSHNDLETSLAGNHTVVRLSQCKSVTMYINILLQLALYNNESHCVVNVKQLFTTTFLMLWKLIEL